MASSSTNTSDNQNDKSKQSSKTHYESKEGSSTSSPIVEEIRDEITFIHAKQAKITEHANDLSPHLIHKRSCAPLAAAGASIQSITLCAKSSRERRDIISHANYARPFEEIVMEQPTTDVPFGTFPKPGDKKSS